jgi:hypothetical protein
VHFVISWSECGKKEKVSRFNVKHYLIKIISQFEDSIWLKVLIDLKYLLLDVEADPGLDEVRKSSPGSSLEGVVFFTSISGFFLVKDWSSLLADFSPENKR